MTYPLVAHFATGVLGPPGDNFEYLYKLQWFKRALFDLEVSPFFTPDVFYPQGYHLALHEMSLANIALGMPVIVLCGETVAYNALVLLSFALSGLGVYLLALRLTRERVAALLSGIVYAFCSYRMGHLGAGHLNLLGTQWLPFVLVCLEQVLDTKRTLSAILVGVFFALSALSSWYYAPMFAIFAAVYMWWRSRQAGRAQQTGRERFLDSRLWRLFAVAAVVAAALMAPNILYTAQQWSEREMAFSLREVDVFSASLGDWFVPNVMHPLWGKRVASYYAGREDVPEHMIALSWVAMLLAVAAVWPRFTGGKTHVRTQASSSYVLLLGLSLVLASGTTLHIGGQRVYISVPGRIEKGFTALMALLADRLALHPMPTYYDLRIAGAIYVPLPTLLFYLYFPFFDAMRVWTRFGLISAFAIAVLAGIGLSRILQSMGSLLQYGQRRVAIAWICLLLVLVELVAVPYPLGWTEVQAQPVDQWLAQQTEEGAVMQFPLWKAECGPGLYAAAAHGKPLAYGYGAFFPSSYRQVRPVLWGFPSSQAIALLRDWGVKYVLMGAESYGTQWPEMQRRLSEFDALQLVAAFTEKPLYHSGWLAESLPDFSRAFIVDQVYVYRLG